MSIYEIRVKGRLDTHWAAWFEGLTVAYDGDTTVLRGSLVDEAALHSMLSKFGNLNLHLLSVNTVEREATDSASPVTPATPDTPCLFEPEGVWARDGELLVADTNNHRVLAIDLATGNRRDAL